MDAKSFNDNWIQYKDDKLPPSEFTKDKYYQENEPTKAVIEFINDWQSEQTYILQKTSGSTGKPKTIKISKSQIKASALATLNSLQIKSGDSALLCINPDFIGGKMMIARALIGGLNLSIGPISGNPLKDFRTLQPIDFFSFVPYQLQRILEESSDKIEFLNSSKAIILGGAPVSDILTQMIKANLSESNVYSTYGMTETVSHVALKLLNSEKDQPFIALNGITFSVDQRGCLRIHAPEVSGQTTLVTNDVVNLISPTEFHWLGRYDYVINSGGIKIHPEVLEKEIASVFDAHHIKNRFFIFGLPDERLGESINLVIEGPVEQAAELLRNSLKPFHSPKKIFYVNKLVDTDSGKISRIKTINNIMTL